MVLERIPEQQPAFPSTAVRGAPAAVTLEEQEAAFETVFAKSSKVPVALDSAVAGGEKQELWCTLINKATELCFIDTT